MIQEFIPKRILFDRIFRSVKTFSQMKIVFLKFCLWPVIHLLASQIFTVEGSFLQQNLVLDLVKPNTIQLTNILHVYWNLWDISDAAHYFALIDLFIW